MSKCYVCYVCAGSGWYRPIDPAGRGQLTRCEPCHEEMMLSSVTVRQYRFSTWDRDPAKGEA